MTDSFAYVAGRGLWVGNRGRDDDIALESDSIHDAPSELHALAALALHGQPFGFSAEDVANLRYAADHAEEAGDREPVWSTNYAELTGALRSLAARIEALLPPEEK